MAEQQWKMVVNDRISQPEGVNGSQLKFLEGTQPMYQIRLNTPIF
jgi:hypothetical protein